ncbi:MAG: 30S ribosomal protein S17 [Bdellovibrionales bacterium]
MAEENKKTRGTPNQVIGVVVSDKMNKTISVEVSRMVKHKRYGKYIRRSALFKAHDETNTAKAGDKVLITETRRLSKSKCWKLADIIEKAKV